MSNARFTGFPVATGNNRVNSQGGSIGNVLSRSSQVITNVIVANGTLQVPAAGTNFYVLVATGSISIKPSKGVFNEYLEGTGLDVIIEENAFELLEIKNNTANPVVFSIFVGFSGYIDNRLILAESNLSQIPFPTYPTPLSATSVAIIDRSGTIITDVNGLQWYAISRVCILCFNPDTGVTYLVQKSGSVTATDLAIGCVYPQTSLRLDVNGNYTINVGGGSINAIVSEIYTCLPKP